MSRNRRHHEVARSPIDGKPLGTPDVLDHDLSHELLRRLDVSTHDALVAALHPSLECLECTSTIVARCVDPVHRLAMVRRDLRERDWDAVATAWRSKHEHGSRMPGHRDEKSLSRPRDLQETRPDLAVRTSRIDKYADDRTLCLQKIDDLSLWLNRGPTPVHPDWKAVPGDGLLQCTR